MLKIIGSSNLALKVFKTDNNEVVKVSNRVNKTIVNSFRNLMHVLKIQIIKKHIFLTPNTKKVFNYLKQTFIKVSIP